MAQKISTEEELEVLLCSLGGTSAEVASTLVVAGIKGKRRESDCCPVANWLRAETGYEPAVDALDVSLIAGSLELAIDPPKAITDFVIDFDRSVYPELDERPARNDD